MPGRVVVGLTLVCLAVASSPLEAQFRKGPRGEQEAARKGWIFSLDSGREQARKTGKPLMVVVRCVP